jgi:hypothetical protein
MQSTGVCSINHGIATSLALRSTTIFLKPTPNLHRNNSVRVDPHAHPQHVKVLKHFVYIKYGCGMHITGGLSLNHDISTSLALRSTPKSLKVHPKPAQA